MERALVSVVVPTLNEAENLPALVEAISAGLRWRGCEIIIVDDGSTDGTAAVCEKLARSYPVRVYVRKNATDGLAGAAIEGLGRARGEYLVVMDADLQHPPGAIPQLLTPLEKGEADFVIGSRYADGGSIDERWSFGRRVISGLATLLARPLVGNIRDPMAGFFALKRSTFAAAEGLSPLGYKIALELMCKCPVRGVREVPICFGTREKGKSKMNIREPIRYLHHLARLYDARFPRLSPTIRFMVMAMGGVAAGLGIKLAAMGLGLGETIGTMLACLGLVMLTCVIQDRREVGACEVVERVGADSKKAREAA